jgi:hypothetical protein
VKILQLDHFILKSLQAQAAEAPSARWRPREVPGTFQDPSSGPFGPLLRQSLLEPGTFNERQRDEKWFHNLLQFRAGRWGLVRAASVRTPQPLPHRF